MSGTGSGPRIYTIPAGVPFGRALVTGLLSGDIVARDLSDPLSLARVTLLMPTRRSCRAIQDEFLRCGGGTAMLLPRIRPLGDVDDDEGGLGDTEGDSPEPLPPAISGIRRQLLLAQLVRAWDDAISDGETQGGAGSRPIDHIVRLAGELGRFLDAVQIEQVDTAKLETLVPAQYADHWREVLDFLRIVTSSWPEILTEEEALDPALRRNATLELLSSQWQRTPPKGPVIAAGSTGTVPATAELMKVIAGLPDGMVVLPGLDTALDEAAWQALDATHPQFALKQLLARLGVRRESVQAWPAATPDEQATARTDLIREALRPAETTHAWHALGATRQDAVDNLEIAECDDLQQEAGVIALRMRAALLPAANGKAADRTAALVTADRQLARRVIAELGRWEIDVDDSAGAPLGQTPAGAFLRLTAGLADTQLAPIELLSALKHPLAAGGTTPGRFRAMTRELELACLRGPRPSPGLDGIRSALGEHTGTANLRGWLTELDAELTPLTDLWSEERVPIAELVRVHATFTEWLSGTDDAPGNQRLWAGEAGEAAAALVADMLDNASAIGSIRAREYAGLLEALMEGRSVRPRFGRHPRLFIWGPLEARLQRADVMILGGLNEGSWPPEAGDDPWMSRPMRDAFGLPPHERRVGLSAHDFAQAAAAPEVLMTRARRAGGGPTVPSRWLVRLGALLSAGGVYQSVTEAGGLWRHWHDQVATPGGAPSPVEPPAPCPPAAARPRRLSVTQVERWVADPYSIYARHILKLRPLEDIDAPPGAAERGTVIHEILDRFVSQHPDTLPPDAKSQLIKLGGEMFAAKEARPGVFAFWWPRFERIVDWFITAETARRVHARPLATELSGELVLGPPEQPFILTAKADRIDRFVDGGLAILDYKTGMPPTNPDVVRGKAPQLPLEAAIAQGGGFPGVNGKQVAELSYWRLSGSDPAGKISVLKGDPAALAAEAIAGLETLIEIFDNPETPYLPVPRPAWAPHWNDYEHLARTAEWASALGEEGQP